MKVNMLEVWALNEGGIGGGRGAGWMRAAQCSTAKVFLIWQRANVVWRAFWVGVFWVEFGCGSVESNRKRESETVILVQ